MPLYDRRQLLVLLALLGAAGGGLGVNRWRASHPEIVERIERLDRDPDPAPASPQSVTPRAARREPPPAVPAPPRKRERNGGAPSPRVDINHASAEELRALPGVGAKLAARIVAAREAGRFASVDELRRVPGVGPAKLERLRPAATIGP